MEGSQMWITTLVVLCGLSWNSYGQKTFRRACDCEYMVDGKCAYTLLLPSGQRGEGMCPPSGNTDSRNDEMPEDMQQRVNDLHRNYTQLLSMYSSQATMLNQVYSTLIDKLLACPLLQACAMPEINVPTFTVPVPTAEIPGHEMPDVTIPDIDTDMPEMEKTSISDPEMPEITMPDIDVEMPEEVTMPNVEIPVPKCADVCPDLETELESIRMMSGEVDQTIITNVADIANITNQIRHINATLDELLVRVATGNNGGNAGNGGQPTDGGLGNQQPPIPGGGVMPNGDLPGQMGGQNGLNVNLASLALWVNNIINNGALCLKKGPLVSGDDASIPDESITASSVFNDQHIASRVRIHSEDEGDLKGAWCPGNSGQSNAQGEPNIPGQEWIQFDLGRVRTVYGIVTRGRADYEQWVETYMVYYAQELNKWDELVDMLGLDTVIFDGNKNQNSPNYNYFDNPIQARYVRIIPLSANEGQNMCMRADIIGCVEEPTLP